MVTVEVENCNIVFALPPDQQRRSRADPVGGGRELAQFYAELLGMQVTRQDWYMIAKEDKIGLHLAFGDGPNKQYRAPRWPDPEYPQQLHLDFPVSDLRAADELAVRLGAARLRDWGEYRTYADPVGHPFCLYPDPSEQESGRRPLSGRIVVDCFSPRALANFYASLLDMPGRELDTPERVVISRDDDRLPSLAFQHAQFPAPRWPDPAYPQQVHLDIWFSDAEAAGDLASRLGAIRLPDIGGSAPVYADPAGHPFCLCSEGS